MADQYVNPQTDKLLCPINGFKDCVEARCFFWTRAADAVQLYESVFQGDPPAPVLRDTCKLLVLGQLSESVLRSVETIQFSASREVDVLSAIIDRMRRSEESWQRIEQGLSSLPQPSPPADLALHRQLREISEKLDALLTKS